MKKIYIFFSIAAFIGMVIFACSSKGGGDSGQSCEDCEQGNDPNNSNPNNPGDQSPVVCEDISFDLGGGGETSETGSCVPPPGQAPNGASFPSGKEICITVGGKCYKCNPERGDDCLSGWLWDGKQVDSDWWFTEVSCGGSSGTTGLICSGFSSSVFAGQAVAAPTVKCGSSVLTSGVVWEPANLNWSSPARGCYHVKATANCGGSSKTASCGNLIVNSVPTLTCANIVAGQVGSPIVYCGGEPIPFSSITWESSPAINWASLAAGTYTNIKATAASGDCKGQAAACSGTLTISATGGQSSSSTASVPSSSSVGSGSGNCGAAVNYPALTTGSKGWTSRYWDGCKQSCSWGGKQQYSPLTSSDRCRACSSNGTSEIRANDAEKSSCDEGSSYTCFDFTPCKVNDNLAYAFAASPTDLCGKCFQIQFDGGFQHGSANATHAAIKGKTLIVMTSNMGGDVSQGQFDILVPGGGVGQFNAFSSQIGVSVNSLGEQYGGLLSACEKENNYNSSQYASCLTTKCNVFTNATLKAGCLFYVDWFKAANNPTMIYKEVACPQYLLDKYKATLK
jgi:hypothetical protein